MDKNCYQFNSIILYLHSIKIKTGIGNKLFAAKKIISKQKAITVQVIFMTKDTFP